MEDPVVPLERNLYGHPLAGLLWERQCEKLQLKHGWEKIPNCECLFVHRETGLFLSVYVDDIKLAGKKQNLDPMWKLLDKEVDLREPTFFLDHVYLGCTQRQCQISKDIVNNDRTMFESHGSNKFVMDSNNNDTEVPEDQLEEHALELNVKDFACRSKAKTKPQRREPAGYSPSIIPMNERKWIKIEPGDSSLPAYEISKKVINLLRHSQQVQREDDGAVHFWRIKEHLQSQFAQIPYWSDNRWKHAWQQDEEQKGDISTALTFQE